MPAGSPEPIPVYLEIGAKKTFAGALAWPGWCRAGTDQASALDALIACAPRYAAILRGTRLGFEPPNDRSGLTVVERLEGNATTDFGAPGLAPRADALPVDDAELRRLEKILGAAWRAFDGAVAGATGKTLSTGPRGGGRSLAAIVGHLIEADRAYLGQVGWKASAKGKASLGSIREAILAALAASAAGEIPARGPRGGIRWTARYFARRVAWHVVAHAWEIDRRVS